MPPPYEKAAEYWIDAATRYFLEHYPQWTPEETTNTAVYLWYDNYNFRRPFYRACEARASNLPEWDQDYVTGIIFTKEESSAAKARYQSNRQGPANPRGIGGSDTVEQESFSEDAITEEAEDDIKTNGSREHIVASTSNADSVLEHNDEEKDENPDDSVDSDGETPGLDSGIDIAKPERTRSFPKVGRPSRSSRTSRSSQTRTSIDVRNQNEHLKAQIAALQAQFVNEKGLRQKAEENAHDVLEKSKQLQQDNGDFQDEYPYRFWPPPPWDLDPSLLPLAPNLWRGQNPTPVRGEVNKREGTRQFANRKATWERDKEANRQAWLGGGLRMWPVQDETRWVGAKFLGSGSYGTAGLWIKVDDNNTIIERVVGKECKPASVMWCDPKEWRGRLPREIRNHKLIDSTRSGVSHRSLIRHQGYRLMMTKKKYRLYLEYCSYDTLYHSMWDRYDLAHQGRWHEIRPLPERYIWYVFSELVNACLILEQGDLSGAKQGWRPIVHADLHEGNIFLDRRRSEDDSIHPTWPKVIVADFGRAFYDINTSKKIASICERDNPREYRLPRPDNRYPMETHPASQGNIKITSKCDVWMISAVIFSLISHANTEGPRLEDGTPAVTGPFHRQNILQGQRYPLQIRYTNALKDLVAHCLSFHPDNRPTLIYLQEEIAKMAPIIDNMSMGTDPNPRLNLQPRSNPFAIGGKHRMG